MPRWGSGSQLDAMSIAGLISGRDSAQALRAVRSESKRVRKTLEAVAPVRRLTDRMDIFLFAPRQWAAMMNGEQHGQEQ